MPEWVFKPLSDLIPICAPAFLLQTRVFGKIIAEKEVCRTFSEGTGKGIPNSAWVGDSLTMVMLTLCLKSPRPLGIKIQNIGTTHKAVPGSPHSLHTVRWALSTSYLLTSAHLPMLTYHLPLWLNSTYTSGFNLNVHPSPTPSALYFGLTAPFVSVIGLSSLFLIFFGWQASFLMQILGVRMWPAFPYPIT